MQIPKNVSLNYYELILTEDCNLRCKYCFDDYFCQRSGNNSIMSTDMIPDIIEFIHKTHDRKAPHIVISFFGGEPMMNYKFIKSFVQYNKDFSPLNFEYHINTNGTYLNNEVIDFFVENNFRVTISIDGKQESHNLNRNARDKNMNSWSKTMKYLPNLISKYRATYGEVPMNVIMVVDENNYEKFSENFMFLRSLDLQVNSLFNVDKNLTDEFIDSIISQYEKLFYKNGVRPFPIEYDRRILSRIKSGIKKNTSYCFDPDRTLTIDTNGKLAFCHQLVPKMNENMTYDNYYGDIYDGFTNIDFYKIIKNRVTFDKFEKDKQCETCIANFWCAGGCVASCWFENNNFEGLNENQCKLHIAFTKLALKYHKIRK